MLQLDVSGPVVHESVVEEGQEKLGVAGADLLERQSMRVASGFCLGAQALEIVVEITCRHSATRK